MAGSKHNNSTSLFLFRLRPKERTRGSSTVLVSIDLEPLMWGASSVLLPFWLPPSWLSIAVDLISNNNDYSDDSHYTHWVSRYLEKRCIAYVCPPLLFCSIFLHSHTVSGFVVEKEIFISFSIEPLCRCCELLVGCVWFGPCMVCATSGVCDIGCRWCVWCDVTLLPLYTLGLNLETSFSSWIISANFRCSLWSHSIHQVKHWIEPFLQVFSLDLCLALQEIASVFVGLL